MIKLRIDGVIGWDVLANDVAARLEGAGDVEMIINSPGGSILEGFSIFNALKAHTGNVVATVDFAGSMASVIAMAADTITMRENTSVMMIHRPWSYAMGRSDDMRHEADALDKFEGMLSGIYLEKAGDKLSAADLADLLEAETWLTAKEAKAIGLADTIDKGDSKAAACVSLGGGVHMDLSKLAATLARNIPVTPEIDRASSLSDLEGVLRESCRLSKADATGLISRVRSLALGEQGADKSISKIEAQIRAATQRLM